MDQVTELESAILQRANRLAAEFKQRAERSRDNILREASDRLRLREEREILAAKTQAERSYRQRVQAAEIKHQEELDRLRWDLVRDDNPVIMFEHKLLYWSRRGDIEFDGDPQRVWRPRRYTEGSDLTLLAWGAMGRSVAFGATVPGSGYTAGAALLGEIATTFAMVSLLAVFLGFQGIRAFTPAIFPFLYAVMVNLEAPLSGTSTNPAAAAPWVPSAPAR